MKNALNSNYVVLVGKSRTELQTFAESLGHKAYRGSQLYDWIYLKNVHEFDKMTNLPIKFKEQIKKFGLMHPIKKLQVSISESNKTKKFLFLLANGEKIESVLMKEQNRLTICLSTQIGCAVDCAFCATGKMGFTRNLSVGEIVDQYLQIQKESKKGITNIVFMGMGEPFLNYDNVISASKIFNDSIGINLSSKKITISTSGIIPKIKQFAKDGQKYKLAVSLNGSTQKQRIDTMPIAKSHPMDELLSVCKFYTKKSRMRITFEYVLLKGINDSIDDAQRLKKILSPINCKLNIIPYNEIDSNYFRPEKHKIETFIDKFNGAPFPVTVRWSKGEGIEAGCGQLVTENLKYQNNSS
tara:strand:- start:21317 stop:22381 length:1065 start_codon:yes stop_codon:yes gene_type:complete